MIVSYVFGSRNSPLLPLTWLKSCVIPDIFGVAVSKAFRTTVRDEEDGCTEEGPRLPASDADSQGADDGLG